jgi:hypothetical protein
MAGKRDLDTVAVAAITAVAALLPTHAHERDLDTRITAATAAAAALPPLRPGEVHSGHRSLSDHR